MIALRHSTRPLRREDPKGNRFHDKIRPLVETMTMPAKADGIKKERRESRRTGVKQVKVRTRFNSRAEWRHSYCKARKAKITAERAMCGDWRVYGLNRTPIILRSEFAGASVVSLLHETQTNQLAREHRSMRRSQIEETTHARNSEEKHRRRQTEYCAEAELEFQVHDSIVRTSVMANATPQTKIDTSTRQNTDILEEETASGHEAYGHQKLPNATVAKLIRLEIEATETEIEPLVHNASSIQNGQANNNATIGSMQSATNPQWQITTNATSNPQREISESADEEPHQHSARVDLESIHANGQNSAHINANISHQFGFGIHNITVRYSATASNLHSSKYADIEEAEEPRLGTSHKHITQPRATHGGGRRSRYVQLYSRRKMIRLRVIQASITPPEL